MAVSSGTDVAGALRTGTSQGRWVLTATIAGSSVAMLDATVVNVALARIGEELDVGFAGLQWIVNAYTLTLASFILVGGVLGDRFGRRRVFVIGMVWFAVASALCAVSVDKTMLIGARALQGVGGALLTPGSLAIISSAFAPSDRAKAIGTWSGLGGIASAAGPFLGGWLVEIDWRLVFLINLPLALVVVVVAARHVPETRQSAAAESGLDLPGSAILVLALSLLTFALTRAGESGWSGLTVVTALAGVVAFVGFVTWERTTAHPLVPPIIFTNRVFSAANVVTVFVYAALGVYFFLLVIQLQVVSGWSPVASGTALLPATLLMLLLSGRFGALSERVGPRPLMTLGALLAGGGFLLSLRVGPDARFLPDVLPAVAVLGLGLACVVAPLTAAVLGSVQDDLAGAASGINNATARTAGLLAVVVVPAVAGLSSAGLSDADQLEAGFVTAMAIGAGLLAIGALASWFGVGPLSSARSVLPAVPGAAPATEPVPVSDRIRVYRQYHCAASGPVLYPRAPGSAPSEPTP